jgi:hypothetical protein
MKRKRLIVVSAVCTVLVAGVCAYFLNVNAVHSNRFRSMIAVGLPPESRVLVEKDEHGALGDGEYYAEIQLTRSGAQQFLQDAGQTGEWHPLPLPNDVNEIIYGDYVMGKICRVPPISRGRYFAEDRYAEMYPSDKMGGLLNRSAINVTIALLNTDTSLLYIYKLDT